MKEELLKMRLKNLQLLNQGLDTLFYFILLFFFEKSKSIYFDFINRAPEQINVMSSGVSVNHLVDIWVLLFIFIYLFNSK